MSAKTVARQLSELATATVGRALPIRVRAWDRSEFGPDDGVRRLYLVGGALEFKEGRMGVNQILAVRAADDRASGMPATPRWVGAVGEAA